jgi:hypothetical protein
MFKNGFQPNRIITDKPILWFNIRFRRNGVLTPKIYLSEMRVFYIFEIYAKTM